MEGPAQLAPGVWGLGSALVNWYLVEDEGRLTAVDAGMPGFAGRLEEDLRAVGHALSDVEAVVLTHSDGDHTGLAPQLREAGARVLIHADDDATLRKPGPKGGDASVPKLLMNAWRPELRAIVRGLLREGGAKTVRVEGAETFTGGDVLDVPGRPRVIHTPGHTRGHCALHFAGHDALFAGDAFITHDVVAKGRGPSPMPSYLNVDTAQTMASLERIAEVEAGLLLLGHGDPWRQGPRAAVERVRANARK